MGKKIAIAGGVVVALALIYTGAGFLGVPAALKWAAQKYGEPLLDRSISIKEVRFNPFTLELKAEGLDIRKPGDGHALASLNSLDTKISWRSLKEMAPVIERLTLEGFSGYVVRTGLDRFSFSDIIDKFSSKEETPEEADKEPLKFALDNISIRNSAITLEDRFRGKTDKITDLNFALPIISNFTDQVDHPITPRLDFKFNNEPLSIEANSVPFTQALKTGVSFTVTGISLENLASFNPVPLNAKVTSGTLDAALNLSFARDTEKEPGHLSLKGTLKLKDVALDDTMGRPYRIVSSKEINVNLKEFAFFRQNLSLGEIQLQEPFFTVVRNKDGINVTELASHIVKENKNGKTAKAQPRAPEENLKETQSAKNSDGDKKPGEWSWDIEKISLRSGTLSFTDQTAEFAQNATDINASMGPLGSKAAGKSDISLSLKALSGSLSAKGVVALSPFEAKLTLSNEGLSIPEVMPYLKEFLNAKVTHGTFSNAGDLTLSSGKNFNFGYKGSAQIQSLNITDKRGAPEISAKSLEAKGVEIEGSEPLSVTIQALELTSANVNVERAQSGQINLAGLLVSKPDENAPKPASAPKKQEPSSSSVITVGSVQVKDSRLRYSDATVEPAFRLNATQIRGSVGEFSTAKNEDAKVSLNALIGGTPLQVQGTVNPFASDLKLNMKGEVKALSMPAFSPYSAEFTGYPIEKGVVTYKGHIDIQKGKLVSENLVEISKLEFGAQSPKAKETLPVGLAVSLLQDRQGNIDLNLPVTGELSDPEFSVGGLIVKVIVNLISKAVTAPFALIGSMFGGEDLDLSNLQFAAGSAGIDDTTAKALDVVAKAMAERPGIKLRITGLASEAADAKGLKQRLLLRDMKYTIYRETTKAVEAKSLTPVQIASAVKVLFSESEVPNKPALTDPVKMNDWLVDTKRLVDSDYVQLADMRAQAVRTYLTQKAGVDPTRLFIVRSEIKKGAEKLPGAALGVED